MSLLLQFPEYKNRTFFGRNMIYQAIKKTLLLLNFLFVLLKIR